MKIHIGVFAHNEQDGIAAAIGDIARQDLFLRPELSVRMFILANGCRDGTAQAAREAVRDLPDAIAQRIAVLDLPQGGKSRTWNFFVHELCAGWADLFFCVDGDIRVPSPKVFSRMVDCMNAGDAWVVSSRPRKDIELAGGDLSLVERLIVAAASAPADHRGAIAGSLYLARTDIMEGIHMPVGLPVEDGFLRAMVVTRLLTQPEDLGRIRTDDDIWHVYRSLRTVGALVRHQTRLVIGGAVNTAVFDQLCAHGEGVARRSALLHAAARDDQWLARMLQGTLPRWPSGFVPAHFLVKRLLRLRSSHGMRARRALVLATVGFPFDVLVYLNAQLQMARGKGAGYW